MRRLNNIPPHTKLNIGDQINIPAAAHARATQPEQPRCAQPKALKRRRRPRPQPKTAALPKAQPKRHGARQPPAGRDRRASRRRPPSRRAADQFGRAPATACLSFRWPAKGRIIAGFGPKTNGQQNDGINLAVPEGTPVKAAEDGVVAYAGNELKGYGNLVLVRHANGYVTAYAHAKELLVKRGDPIKRGQVIARSGQTGNVDAPQLHFEIRKGPTPIDPMPHLSGG